MKKAIAVALLLFVPSAEAKPRWKDWKFWAVTGLAAGSTAFQVRAAHNCRANNDVSACFGGYGSPKAMSGLIIGESAGMYAISQWTRHPLATLGSSSFNFASGIKQTQADKPKEMQ